MLVHANSGGHEREYVSVEEEEFECTQGSAFRNVRTIYLLRTYKPSN